MLNHPYMTQALVDARRGELLADAAATRTPRSGRLRFRLPWVVLPALPRPRPRPRPATAAREEGC
jgi:hypothetical protein